METQTQTKSRAEGAGRAPIAERLGRLVADTYVLYFQTQSFHWNVRGPSFASLHALFQTQYEELATAIDTLAERIRALGALAPSSLPEMLRRTKLEVEHAAPSSRAMVEILLRAHEHVAREARDAAELAEGAKDLVTHGMLLDRAEIHDKAAWMLRATLEDDR
jgi:starvation-inducible DNA-binding protein